MTADAHPANLTLSEGGFDASTHVTISDRPIHLIEQDLRARPRSGMERVFAVAAPFGGFAVFEFPGRPVFRRGGHDLGMRDLSTAGKQMKLDER